MKHIGFLSFGHWTPAHWSEVRTAADAHLQTVELAVAAEERVRAAELLGVTRPTLYDLLEKHQIDASQFGKVPQGAGTKQAS